MISSSEMGLYGKNIKSTSDILEIIVFFTVEMLEYIFCIG